MKRVLLYLTILCSYGFSNINLSDAEKRNLGDKAMHQIMQSIWTEAMQAKAIYNEGIFNTRQEYLENVCSTSPLAPTFTIHADVSDTLLAGNPSASIFVSWDNQNSWTNVVANPLDPTIVGPGYESTWGAETPSENSSVDWYLAGEVNSEALGYDYGTMILSGSPHNVNQNFPLNQNLYGLLANDESGDASSNQDVLNVKGSYYDDLVEDADGVGNGAERFYVSMEIDGGCCEEGGLFGPWFLYGVGIVNPDSETPVAYAIGYGNGGFGQLYPALYKIAGDLSTGEISGFEAITEDINYDTSGDFMQATTLMSYITNDSDWGEWPNSVYGFIALGVSVEAGLSGLDVVTDVKDQTSPGLFIMNTTSQDGNDSFELSDMSFNADDMMLYATYTDIDGNLPWFKSFQICNPDGSNCFINEVPVPDAHTYEDGVIFSAYIGDALEAQDIPDGEYSAKFAFADGEYNPNDVEYLDITIGSGSGCALVGDVNGDDTLNVLDVVLLVNLILGGGETTSCGDVNGDDSFNVLDVVLLVNIILG